MLPHPSLIFGCNKCPYRSTYARLQQTSERVRSPCCLSVLHFILEISVTFRNTGRAERRQTCYPLAGVREDFIYHYVPNEYNDEMLSFTDPVRTAQ